MNTKINNRNNETAQDLSRGSPVNLFTMKDHSVVRDAVSQLKGYEHQVILMRFWEQNTITEIADILDLSWAEVEEYLEAAMQKLKTICLKTPFFSRSKPDTEQAA